MFPNMMFMVSIFFMWHKKISSVGGSFLQLIFFLAFSHLRIFIMEEVLVLPSYFIGTGNAFWD